MRQLCWLLVIGLVCALPAPAAGKRGRHLRSPRVRAAVRSRGPKLAELFRERGVPYPASRVLIRIFKKQRVLELWAAGRKGRFVKVRDYAVCAASGRLGPKRRQGDLQVPEGVYHISVFNPWSAYHLSLGINYPNRSDRILGRRGSLGSAIMIHGDCVSIGCVAITDKRMEELYLVAAGAYARGQRRIPVHIFPTRLDRAGMAWLAREHALQPRLLAFWGALQPVYRYFERHRTLPRVRVTRRGRYVVVD